MAGMLLRMPAPSSHDSPSSNTADRPRLAPVLGLFTATTLVIGEVIGSGIFFKPKPVAEATDGYLGLILGLWLLCGLVNLCGALTMGELGAMMPHAGGNYVFLRQTYGPIVGFLWGWAEFWVIRTGAIAALATAMAMSLAPLLASAGLTGGIAADTPAGARLQQALAVAAILLLAAINIARTRWGGAVQNVTTVLKIASLVLLAALPLLYAHEPVSWDRVWPQSFHRDLWAGLGAALAGIMWAYDGWGQVTVVAEEIKDPQRNVPRALAAGLLLLIALYLAVNVAFHAVLTTDQLRHAAVPAADFVTALLGARGGNLMLAILVVSTFGALNSNILVGPRVAFSVARDEAFLRPLSHIDPRTGTPTIAIAALSGWSIVLVLLGDLAGGGEKPLFHVLTDYAIFGGSIFYFLAVLAVFVLRARHPDWPRPYRTWGYPWTPLTFVVFYVFLLVSMFVANPRESAWGLSLIVAGAVVYAVLGGRKGDANRGHGGQGLP